LVSDLIRSSAALIDGAGVESVAAVRRHPRRLLAFSPPVEAERLQLREFLYQNLYYSPKLRPDKEQAEQVISELFEFFLRSPRDLPASYQEKLEQEPLYRIVCDYIAGMTDNFVLEQHRRHCATPKGAIV
jgi:dGTPase